MTILVQILWALAGTYLLAGAILLVPFHARALARIDPATKGAPIFFRLLITPGLIALWPVILKKWRDTNQDGGSAGPLEAPLSARHQRKAHGALILMLAITLLPLSMIAVYYREAPPITPQALPQGLVLISADYPRVGQYHTEPFKGLPITLKLRYSDSGECAVEVVVSQVLDAVPAVLYFQPGEASTLAADALFLGGLWGPATLTYALPATGGGDFTIIAWSFQTQASLGAAHCIQPAEGAR
ncbi:MAG: hypothetical protein HYV27_09530 [Candidatus Hydrogenedentes bacterium]|nr:hypothetical protein [Candidatus Hydrogenedentota bacterium]